MYSETIPEEELRARLKGRELTEDEFEKAMHICHLQGLETTDQMDTWIAENKRLVATGKMSLTDAASIERVSDLVERLWLSLGLTLALDAKRQGLNLADLPRSEMKAAKLDTSQNTCAFCGNLFIQKQGKTRICVGCRLKANLDGIESIDPTGEGRKALKKELTTFVIRWIVLIAVITCVLVLWYRFS